MNTLDARNMLLDRPWWAVASADNQTRLAMNHLKLIEAVDALLTDPSRQELMYGDRGSDDSLEWAANDCREDLGLDRLDYKRLAGENARNKTLEGG